MDTDLFEPTVEVVVQDLSRPKIEVEAKAQAGDERAVDAQIEAAEQFLVAAEQERKRRRRVRPGAGEQAQFFQRRNAQILRFLDQEQRPSRSPLLPEFAQGKDVVASAIKSRLAGELDQLAEQVRAYERAVGESKEAVLLWGESFAPAMQ